MSNKISKGLLALVLAFSWAPFSIAQQTDNPPWYRVDLLIFAQPGNHLEDEVWDTSVVPSHNPNAIEFDKAAQSLVMLDVSNKVDLPVATSQMKRQGYQLLFARSWNQMMLPKADTRPIRIQAGEKIGEDTFELDGEISIDIARYLHFRTNLFLSKEVSKEWLASKTPTLEVSESEQLPEAPTLDEFGFIQGSVNPEPALTPQPSYLSVNMNQSRRMRRDELHYLDHPFFGIVVRMTRLDLDTETQPDTPIVDQPAAEPLASTPVEKTSTGSTTAVDLPVPVNAPAISQ